jgi:alpha-glucosidase
VLAEARDLAVAEGPDVDEGGREGLAGRAAAAAVVAEGDDDVVLRDELLRHGAPALPLGAEFHEHAVQHRLGADEGAGVREAGGLGPLDARVEQAEHRRHVAAREGGVAGADGVERGGGGGHVGRVAGRVGPARRRVHPCMMGSMSLAASLLTLALLADPARACDQDPPHRLHSPDGRIEVILTTEADTAPRWTLSFLGRPRVVDGRFGLTLEGAQELLAGARVERIEESASEDRFDLPFGKTSRVDQPWNEQRLALRTPDGRPITLTLRAYDDAFAFRHEIGALPGEETLRIAAETTAFGLAPPRVVHASWLEHFRTSHEYPVRSTALDAIPDGQLLDTPLTVEFDDGAALAITEAALLRFAGMSLRLDATSGLLHAALSPRDDGLAVVRAAPLATPWRVVLIGDGLGALLESTTLACLNEPPDFDPAWIRPGKLTWPWWNHYLFDAERTEPILSVASARKHLDWCAANGIAYHAIVADETDTPWYPQGRRGLFPDAAADPTRARDDFDLAAIRVLADERGVGLWTWIHHAALRGRVEATFAALARLGWRGVMVDFLDRDDQPTVEFAEEVLRAAARHRVLVHFHGMYKPTGWERTFPHLMNHEGSLNLEYLKWSASCTPEHTLRVVFTRMLAGPMDYHLGGFRAALPADFAPRNEAPLVLGTRGHMLGLYLVLDNPAPMVADFPGAYREQPGFDCIREIPTWWDETRVLRAEAGRLLAEARRRGDAWWLGAIGAGPARELELPLDFLGDGPHALRLWRDADDAGDDPNHLTIEARTVTRDTVLRVRLAPDGGGFVARLAPSP